MHDEENIYMGVDELAAEGNYDPNTGLSKPPLPDDPNDAVMLPEKMGPPTGGIDASQIPPPPDDLPPPPPELQAGNGEVRVMVPLDMDLQTPPQSPMYSPSDEEGKRGDRGSLVFKD